MAMQKIRYGKRLGAVRALAAGVALAGVFLTFPPVASLAQMPGHAHGPGAGHGPGHGHGADGTGHDEVNMPGLQGANATPEESAELAVMFRNFETISREVTDLPDGIRTVTRSSDATVMASLVSHVIGMIDRVERGDDPKMPPRRSKWICVPVEGHLQAFHADLDAAWRAGRWKQETCLRSGLA